MAVTSHVALLRSVNVRGRNAVAMSDLRSMAEALGFARVRTLLQSGNLVFEAADDAADLERALEQALRTRLDLATDVMVRRAVEWSAGVTAHPLPDAPANDPGPPLFLA